VKTKRSSLPLDPGIQVRVILGEKVGIAMKTALVVVLCVYLGIQAFRYLLDCLNLSYMRRRSATAVPEFDAVLGREFLDRMQVYLRESMRFSMVTSGLSTIATVVFFFGGLLDIYNSWIASMDLPFVVSGWVFFVLLYLAWELFSLPFAFYSTFHIEQKHGFNTMTHRVWLLDLLKGTMLSLVLLTAVVFGGLVLVEKSPHFWWFWVWCFSLAFTIFITYIAPYVIEPLFNKFTPVEDEPLRSAIVALALRAGIKLSKVLKMDQSKRSRHTNAYFTGMGRTKRIILFDTLLETMTPDEVLAVLAHEIGHWKGHHLLKGLFLTSLVSLVFFFCAHQAMSHHLLDTLFAIRVATFPAKTVIAGFLGGILSFLFAPVMNAFSRRLEREADRFSCTFQGRGEAMTSALVKLSKDNLSNLYPHPLYALYHYSHPPVLERIKYIRAYCEKEPIPS
jgi:STE24 endopeptidase